MHNEILFHSALRVLLAAAAVVVINGDESAREIAAVVLCAQKENGNFALNVVEDGPWLCIRNATEYTLYTMSPPSE